MMEITDLILKYGLPFVTIALIVVCLVGIVKIFTKGIVNKKEVSETRKKWYSKMYMGLALVFSYVCMLIYYAAILKVNCWTMEAVRDAGIVWAITSPIYELYKQFGGRKLLVAFVSAIQKLFKGKNENVDDVLNIVMTILNEEAPLLTDAQKEAIENRLNESISTTENKDKTEEEKVD